MKPHYLTTIRGRFALEPSETLLAALERTGHRVEFQCRSGYCGACRLTLASGNDDALHYPVSPLAVIKPSQLLPCCCEARGDIRLQLPGEDQEAATSPRSAPLSDFAVQWP